MLKNQFYIEIFMKIQNILSKLSFYPNSTKFCPQENKKIVFDLLKTFKKPSRVPQFLFKLAFSTTVLIDSLSSGEGCLQPEHK